VGREVEAEGSGGGGEEGGELAHFSQSGLLSVFRKRLGDLTGEEEPGVGG
jgi:hypothetical protein